MPNIRYYLQQTIVDYWSQHAVPAVDNHAYPVGILPAICASIICKVSMLYWFHLITYYLLVEPLHTYRMRSARVIRFPMYYPIYFKGEEGDNLRTIEKLNVSMQYCRFSIVEETISHSIRIAVTLSFNLAGIPTTIFLRFATFNPPINKLGNLFTDSISSLN